VRRILKIVWRIVVFTVLLLAVISLLMIIPAVQSWSARKAVNYLNERYQTEISLRTLRYQFPNLITLQEPLVRDHRGDTLIYARQIALRYNGQNPMNGAILSQGLFLDRPVFNLITHPGDTFSGLNAFIRLFKAAPDSVSPQGKPFRLSIDEIAINNGSFRLEDLACDSCYRMWLQDIRGRFGQFSLEEQFVTITTDSLALRDAYHFKLRQLQGRIGYQRKGIFVEDALIETERSTLRGDFSLDYDTTEALNDFIPQVQMLARMDSSTVHHEDIEVFAGGIPPFGKLDLRGEVRGTVNELRLQNFRISGGAASALAGDFTFLHSEDGKPIEVNTEKFTLATSPADVAYWQKVFMDTTLFLLPESAGPVELSGSFAGTSHDFHTALRWQSAESEAQLTARASSLQDSLEARYKLDWYSRDMPLQKILPDIPFQQFSARIQAEGQGYDPRNMRLRVDGTVDHFRYRQHRYRNFNLSGRLQEGRFIGDFALLDSLTQVEFHGTAGFSSTPFRYQFAAKAQNLNLGDLGLLEDSLAALSATMNIDVVGKSLDDWQGVIRVDSLALQTRHGRSALGGFSLRSSGGDSLRKLAFRAPFLDADLAGRFTWAGMAELYEHKRRHYWYKDSMPPATAPNQFEAQVHLKKPGQVTRLLAPNLALSPGTRLAARYSPRQQELRVQLWAGKAYYEAIEADTLSVNYLSSAKTGQLSLELPSLLLPDGTRVDSIFLSNFLLRDTLRYRAEAVLRDSIDSRFGLEGYAFQQGKDAFLASLEGSSFNLGPVHFQIPEGNRLYLDTGGLFIEDLWLRSDSGSLTVNGYINQHDNEILRIELYDFPLDFANYLSRDARLGLGGMINGQLLLNKLTTKEPNLAADVQIHQSVLNGASLGEWSIFSTWFPSTGEARLRASAQRGELILADIQGSYFPRNEDSLSVKIALDNFRLKALEPFASGLITNLRGFADGQFTLEGKNGEPSLLGRLSLPKAGFTIPLLSVDYNFTEAPNLLFTREGFDLNQLQVRDTRFRTTGSIDGQVRYQNFKNLTLDLAVTTDKLLVLNTPYRPDDLYYGTAFVGGSVAIKGNLERITITSNVQTMGATQFNLPLSGATTVERSGFFEFVTEQKDTVAEAAEPEVSTDIVLDFDILVNENATLSVILDEQTDNQMKARGRGPLKLKMDEAGNLALFGTYEVLEGNYRFNLEGYFNRDFSLVKGGTVSWNGDPYAAQLNLTAKYATRADPSLILTNYNGGITLTEVLLHVKGSLTAPEIAFDVLTPRIGSSYQTVLNSRLSDINSRNQQVFSLLAFNSFSPTGSNSEATTGPLINEWDILANQASSWLNHMTGDYQISLDYQSGTVNNGTLANEELGVGVSKKLFNDRISINGMVGVPLNNSAQNLTGDFEIQYDVTPDGQITARAFTRSIQNDYQLAASQIYRHGVGLTYQIDFDSYGELVHRIFQKKQKAIREEEEEF